MEPLFAIITATYNAHHTLPRTLKSVNEQTFTDYEHIIIDGASVDGSAELARNSENPRRRVISEPDKGLYDAMNKGIANTSGRYLIFLNAGDTFHSTDTLALIANAIREASDPGIVYGQTILVDDSGAFVGNRHLTAPEKLTLNSFSNGMLVCHQAFVALRQIVGYYDTKFKYSADYEWCIRCLQHSRCNIGLTDTILINYLHEGLTTAHRLPSLIERFKIMAYYYGYFTAIIRHISFIGRWWKRRNNSNK